jgi:hypothetical protein
LTFQTILRDVAQNRVRPEYHNAENEEMVKIILDLPVCGIVFSPVALHLQICLKQGIDFLALAGEHSLRPRAEIQIRVTIEEMIFRIEGCFGTFDDP